MPLDRPLTVRIFAAGARDDSGGYTPGAATDFRVWGGLLDASGKRELESGGAREVSAASFRLRWFRELADADLALGPRLLIDGSQWRITSVAEGDNFGRREDTVRAMSTRRRWLDVAVVKVQAR